MSGHFRFKLAQADGDVRAFPAMMRRFRQVCLVLLVLGFAGTQAQEVSTIPGFSDGSPFLVRAVFVKRSPPQSRPWEVERLETVESPAFFTDERTVLVTRFPGGDLLSARVKVPGSATPYETEVQVVEPELGLAVLRIIGEPVKPRPPVVGFVQDEKLLLQLRQLDCVSMSSQRPEIRTVFLKRAREGVSASGHTILPLLSISGWEADIRPGDVLVSERSVVGIVLEFSAKTRLGLAMPAVLPARFVEEANRKEAARAKPVVITDTIHPQEPALELPVLAHPGFSVVVAHGRAQRLQFGLNTGGVIVSSVLPDSGAASLLVPRDIILAVRGQKVGIDGTVIDPVFGPLSVPAATLIRAGRFVKPNSRVSLTISRERQIREIEIPLPAFSQANVAVPASFREPHYLVLGGLALVELTTDYIKETGGTARLRHLSRAFRYHREKSDERYVVLHQVLPTKLTLGYDGFERLLVISVNETAVRNLSHLRDLVDQATAKKFPVRILLEGNREVVFDPQQLADADKEVREQHGIQYPKNLPR